MHSVTSSLKLSVVGFTSNTDFTPSSVPHLSSHHMHIAAGLKGLKAYKALTSSALCHIVVSVLW